ncbi:hypothetical protein LXL04_034176 [Taraxacum kok-saghyz]
MWNKMITGSGLTISNKSTEYNRILFWVGHAGTLDPMATGLLIVCIGKATKLVDRFQGMVKGYGAVLRLGEAISTLDVDSPILFYRFFFDWRQNVVFRVTCSKGTYIRSLCVDFAKALNSCAHMTILRRDSIRKTSFDFDLFLSYLTCHMFDLKYMVIDRDFYSCKSRKTSFMILELSNKNQSAESNDSIISTLKNTQEHMKITQEHSRIYAEYMKITQEYMKNTQEHEEHSCI